MGLSDVAQWTAGMAIMLKVYPDKPTFIMASGEAALSLGFSLGMFSFLN